MMEELKQRYPAKVVDARTALANIRNGSRIFIGSGCGEPRHLVRALVKDSAIQDAMIFQMFSFTLSDYIQDRNFLSRFNLKLFFISSQMRSAAYEGKVDYVPSYLAEIPRLFNSHQIGLDVALVQISPPDRFGFGSLGVSVDVTRAALNNADLIIAQVNPSMPRTWGDSFVHVDEIDYLVPHQEPLVEFLTDELPDEETIRRIGYYVSELIDDGACLQVGFGHLPYALLQHLEGKKDLGVHTQIINDAFIPLFENGTINNKRKNLLPERAVATLCMGTEKIYDYIHDNPQFYFRTADFVNDPAMIARNDNFISISSALEVDLTGQVASDTRDLLFFGGTGDQASFIRGAAMSRGGFSIVALPSTARKGQVSRIVADLSEGAGVITLRADINFVVTEYGIAQLRGKSIFQRVIELAQVAHPKFRADLIESAKQFHYVTADQLPPPAVDLLFIERYRRRRKLPNGKALAVRPLLPSDEIAYRNFYYSLKEETVYYRFFRKIRVFSHQMAQKHWSYLDYRDNITLIGLVRQRGNKEIVAVGSYMKASENRAEVAFVTREDYQGMGIAGYLLEMLEKIAMENGFKGFVAYLLASNRSMLRVFRKRYPNAEQRYENGDLLMIMEFQGDGDQNKDSDR
ncbi:MAG TPA: GNAT family N-acetyltransferase [Desulfobacterales bacterium]